MTPPSSELVKQPKQERSRQSFDRAVEAAMSLMVERRSGAITVAEVAARSGVSTGSIYARVASKEDLIRVAHVRLMDRLAIETRQALSLEVAPHESLVDLVGRAVRALAELLRRHAEELAPFMRLAHRDPVIAAGGKRAHEEMVSAFASTLLSADGGITRPDPQAAVTWSCTVVYSVLARQLGLGSDPEAAMDQPWDELLAVLVEMVAAYLAPV
ncbi:TetR/AcrR family transcriptional regulator [Pedococcus sp. P5_B7]